MLYLFADLRGREVLIVVDLAEGLDGAGQVVHNLIFVVYLLPANLSDVGLEVLLEVVELRLEVLDTLLQTGPAYYFRPSRFCLDKY